MSLPGGCAIGNRPIDLHLKVLEAFGAKIELAAGYVRAIAPDGGIPGGDYTFPVVSVGATENGLMAAVLAKGVCRMHNAAREPEIVDLCNLLVAMGAEIEGIGSSDITIHGVERLHGATYMVMPDRIEAGSYACAAAITGGEVTLKGARIADMDATVAALREAGVHVAEVPGGVHVATDGPLRPVTVSTAPYPGFATDMQAQLMAMLCKAEGTSVLSETDPHGREDRDQGPHSHRPWRQAADRGRGDGHGSARLDEPGHRRARGRGRDTGPPALPP